MHMFQQAINFQAVSKFPDCKQAVQRNSDRLWRSLVGPATHNILVICINNQHGIQVFE